MKEDGGAIGLRESTPELTRWMIYGPEIATIVNEFKENMPCRRRSKPIYLHQNEPKASKISNSQNTASLFQFMSNCVRSTLFPGLKQKKMMVTYNKGIYFSDGTEPATLSPCNHEEGDYRALLDWENMSKTGVNQAMIFTLDTNVIVTGTSVFSELSLLELWIELGKTANRKYIPIPEIPKSLSPERTPCLTLFQSLTGCDLPGKHGKATHS